MKIIVLNLTLYFREGIWRIGDTLQLQTYSNCNRRYGLQALGNWTPKISNNNDASSLDQASGAHRVS